MTSPKNNKLNYQLLMGILLLKQVPCLKEVFYVFYCLCFVYSISTDMLEEQMLEEIDLDLEEEEYILIMDSREYHWRDVAEYNDGYSSKVHSFTGSRRNCALKSHGCWKIMEQRYGPVG